MILKVLRQYVTNREERVPKRKLGPFRTDSRIYSTPPETGLRVTWMGHSAMLLEMDSVRVLIDPVWDERASPVSWAGPKRFYAAPLRLDELPAIDVVLVSHDHYDHLGKKTIRQLATMETQWITSLGVGKRLIGFGVDAKRIREMDWTESVTAAGLTLTALPARHFSGRSLFNRFETLWSSFVIEGARHKVYYGADSGSWPADWNAFAEIGRAYGPFDLTMLEIGAYNELWKDIHMGPDGALKAFLDMGEAGLLMPIHWGLFDLALHAWRHPIQRMVELADQHHVKLWCPEPGLPTEVVAGEELRSDWYRH